MNETPASPTPQPAAPQPQEPRHAPGDKDLFENLADEILGQGRFFGMPPRFTLFFSGLETDDLYKYHPTGDRAGLWTPDGMQAVKNFIVSRRESWEPSDTGKKPSVNFLISSVQTIVKARLAPEVKRFPVPPDHLIPCQDGVFDLQTGEIRDYCPEYWFTSKLPFPAFPGPDCNPEKILDIFRQWVEKPEMLIELIALCLFRGYPLQKFFFLHGSGANGKGVFLRILEHLLGSDHVSHVPPGKNGLDSQFGISGLFRRLVNIAEELPVEILADSGTLKRLTGESKIFADVKHRPQIEFFNYATLIFALNTIPQTDDRTDAFFRRVEIIDFPNRFDPVTANRRLFDDLKADRASMAGLFRLALDTLRTAYRAGFAFQNIGLMSIADARLKYSVAADTVDFIVQTFCIHDEEAITLTSSIQSAVAAVRRLRDLPPMSPKAITERMNAQGYAQEQTRLGNGLQTVRVWKELRFDSFKFADFLEKVEPFTGPVSTVTAEKWKKLSELERNIIRAVLFGITSGSRISQMTGASETEISHCIHYLRDQKLIEVIGHGFSPPLDGRTVAELRFLSLQPTTEK